MALWEKVRTLPEELLNQVHLAYDENFPIEVRSALSQWIEETPWPDYDDPQHESYAANVVASFIQEIERKAATEENFISKFKLSQAAHLFRQKYFQHPFMLVRIVKNYLQMEMKFVQQAEQIDNYHQLSSQEFKPILNPQQELKNQINLVRSKTQETEADLRNLQQEQEQFVINYQESQRRQLCLQQITASGQGSSVETVSKLQREKEQLDRNLREKAHIIINLRRTLLAKYEETFYSLNSLQQRVLDDELIRWKRGQQLSGNGIPFENNLDQIQEWCESLAEMIWVVRQQLKKFGALCQQYHELSNTIDQFDARLANLNKNITSLLSNLVTSTFIIEKQPPQVMKTNTRFTSTVRLVVGGKLNVHMTPPIVKVSIVSEAQANSLLKYEKASAGDPNATRSFCEHSGEILNNSGTMEYHQATRQLSVTFRNMQLRKIKRAEKKGTESVMDEKFSLLFQAQFNVGGGELVFQVWTLSLPAVVIVHGNQEPHAWATVTWDNAFAEPGRVPFAVPDKVPWNQVGEVLSQKFKASVGRGLTEDNLRFLAGKAFRNTQIVDYNNALLSWSQFSKEPLPERGFTFWEWFFAILKVTKDHLRGLWNDGSVMGFIGRKQAEDMLLKRANGTFLLRFSDSELGGVTIAWVGESIERETDMPKPEVFMLQPFVHGDFRIRSLPDRVNDLKHLMYLYPDVNKDQAFSKYYTPYNETSNTPNGYVKPVLVTHIPGWNGSSPYDSYPNTPQSGLHNPHSPGDSLSYHDNPSVHSNSTDITMNPGGASGNMSDMELQEIMTMDLSDMDYDFSSINDLIGHTPT